MTIDVLRALVTIFDFCYEQCNCNVCPLKDYCSKMPCEWD